MFDWVLNTSLLYIFQQINQSYFVTVCSILWQLCSYNMNSSITASHHLIKYHHLFQKAPTPQKKKKKKKETFLVSRISRYNDIDRYRRKVFIFGTNLIKDISLINICVYAVYDSGRFNEGNYLKSQD